jgi:hypothetical protein
MPVMQQLLLVAEPVIVCHSINAASSLEKAKPQFVKSYETS